MGDQHPGVFVEEIPGAPRPIDGVSTSTAGFIGAAGAPFDGAYVRGPLEFTRRWPEGSAVADAIEQFFANGGLVAWVGSVKKLRPRAVRRAVAALDRDVSVVAVVADPAPSPEVIAAAAEALAGRRAMLMIEGSWADAPSAIAALSSDDHGRRVGAGGADVAVYWPRVRSDGGDGGDGIVKEISPLGPVAGMIARTDGERGVFTAPAGADATLRGVVEPVAATTLAQQEALNEHGVNVIRRLPQGRTVVWGARTQSLDPEWKYVPVRRTVLFLEESLDRGLEWVTFEPNGEALWRAVTGAVQDFLHRTWRQGALQGAKPEEAFFVKCDRTTMTQNDIDNGRLVCSIGIAPLRPAEFVIFSIGKWTADASD